MQKRTPSAAIAGGTDANTNRPAAHNSPYRNVAQRPSAPYGSSPFESRHVMAEHPAPASRMHPRVAPAHEHVRAYSSKLWQTINVAFEGSQELMQEPENLPLPQQMRSRSQTQQAPPSEMTIEGPAIAEHDGMLLPYDAPMDSCGSECGCPNGGMGCGDGMCSCGEAACSCEPACGCPCGCGAETPCILACGEDVCLAGTGDAEACHTIRIGIPKWQELMVFGGVHGFKGPYDQIRDSGNFGFHEGFNAGFKVPFSSAGYQIGYQAVHSQLHGDKDTGIADPHTQQFVTVGLFHREQDGIQLGVAWDMLRDERFGAVDFHQLRGEISLVEHGCHEFGFAAAIHLNEHEVFQDDEDEEIAVFQPTDQYLLFYRFHGPRGGEGRFFGGINDDDDGIIGADLMVPFQDRWSLGTGFTYLIPNEQAGEQGAAHEAWNIGINLVWHWDCRARKCHSNCYRPLFNVADNGYLIVDQRGGATANNGVGGTHVLNTPSIIDHTGDYE